MKLGRNIAETCARISNRGLARRNRARDSFAAFRLANIDPNCSGIDSDGLGGDRKDCHDLQREINLVM